MTSEVKWCGPLGKHVKVCIISESLLPGPEFGFLSFSS